ncbi:MAG: DUF3891 family protein [Anaerolineae bacterium]|nr:DUF3891 family protein [Anaerolineae bacterium]
MIRREEPDAIWLIQQMAHAYISGAIAAHWIGNGTMSLAPRDDLVLAATNHDAGWLDADRQPGLNDQGMPRTFTEMPLDQHFTIWRDSIEAVFFQSRYAGLLTSRHCTALYEQRLRFVADTPDDKARIEDFLAYWHGWQDDQIAAMADHPVYAPFVAPDRLAENVRLLQVWDYLSLLLGMSAVHEQTLDDIPFNSGVRGTLHIASQGLRGMTLDPYPLDAPLTLWIDAREVIGGPFDSASEFQTLLADVPYQPLHFAISPLNA